METRRPARKQALPKDEADLLNTLFDDYLYTRVNQLFDEGWTLQAIGDAFDPPRGRSTIRFWASRRHDKTLLDNPPPRPRLAPRGYVSRRPVSPGISSADMERITRLSPLARKYRAKMSTSSIEARANQELTDLCVHLAAQDVTVRELAAAAGVTYRAMARRLGR